MGRETGQPHVYLPLSHLSRENWPQSSLTRSTGTMLVAECIPVKINYKWQRTFFHSTPVQWSHKRAQARSRSPNTTRRDGIRAAQTLNNGATSAMSRRQHKCMHPNAAPLTSAKGALLLLFFMSYCGKQERTNRGRIAVINKMTWDSFQVLRRQSVVIAFVDDVVYE